MYRNSIVDISKGVGILLVVAMHTGLGYMPGVDMPLFFLISGFFAPKVSKYSLREGLIRKTSALLVPTYKYLLVFSILGYFMARLPNSDIVKQNFLYFFTIEKLVLDEIFYMPEQPYMVILWFCSTLWLAMLLFLLFRGYIDNMQINPTRLTILVFTLIILYICSIRGPTLDENKYLGCLSRAIYAFVFLVFGYLLYPRRFFFSNQWGQYLLIVLVLVSLFFKFKFFFYSGDWPNFDIRSMTISPEIKKFSLIISLSGIALIFSISYFISKNIQLTKIFTYVGSKSFHIMVLHAVGLFFIRIFYKTIYQPAVLINLISFSLALAFSLICISLYDKYIDKVVLLFRWNASVKTLPLVEKTVVVNKIRTTGNKCSSWLGRVDCKGGWGDMGGVNYNFFYSLAIA